MTGIVDRINAWIVGRLGRRQAPRLRGETISLGGQSFSLRDLTRAVGVQEEVFAGQRLALILEFAPGQVVRLSQDDECWPDVLDVLDRLRLTAQPSAQWLTQLLAGDQPVTLR